MSEPKKQNDRYRREYLQSTAACRASMDRIEAHIDELSMIWCKGDPEELVYMASSLDWLLGEECNDQVWMEMPPEMRESCLHYARAAIYASFNRIMDREDLDMGLGLPEDDA